MSYLNPPYPNNFQELCAAMPLYYLDVREMRAVLRAQGYLLDGLCDGVEQVVDFNFILTADEATIRLWEKALEITYNSRLTLEQRRRVVIGCIIGLNHIGEPEIREIIGQYTENHVDFDFLRGTITVVIDGDIFDEENLLETLLRRIPAHLTLSMWLHKRRTFRQELPIAYGGAIGTSQAPQFVVEPRSSALTLQISRKATMTPVIIGEPHTQPRIAALTHRMAHSGALASARSGGPPEAKRTSTGLKMGGKGVFFQTHIKSKLIE